MISAMHKKNVPVFPLILLLLLTTISACSPAPEPPLRLGSNVWPGYEPLYLARSLGYYDNSPIKLVELSSASEVMHAMRNHTLEAAALTLDEAITLMADGIKLKFILVFDFSDGGDALLGKSTITTLKDLKGRRVAVENSATGAVLLDAALQEAGLKPTDIDIVSCTVDRHLTCFQSVDAIVTFEPARTKLLAEGAHILFDSRQIPTRIVDVLVVLDEAAQHNPETLKQLVRGYFQALTYIRQQPEDASRRMAPRMQLPVDEVPTLFDGIRLPSLQENRALLGEPEAKLQPVIDYMIQFMLRQKLIASPVSATNAIDGRFLPAGETP